MSMDNKTELAIKLGQIIYTNTINNLTQQRDDLLKVLVAITTAEDVTEYGAALHDARAVIEKIGGNTTIHNG